MIVSPSHPYRHCQAVKVMVYTGTLRQRGDSLVSGKREKKIRRREKKIQKEGKKSKEINLATIKPLTVLTANPQIHKHTEGVLGIKAFN